jgi:small-conductance mechanosensitive channel
MIDDLRSAFEAVNDQLLDLGTAVLQLIVVFAAAVVVARTLRGRIRARSRVASAPTLAVVLENSVSVGVYVIAFTVVLAFWGLTWTGLITALSISTVAVAFGLQDLLRGVVGGVLVIVERPFAPGDRIKIREIEGRVVEIDLRTTVLQADNGDRITIPNSLIFTEPVITRGHAGRQSIVVTGIPGSVEEAKREAREALAGLQGFPSPPTITVLPRRGRIQRRIDAISGAKPAHQQIEGRSVRNGLTLRISWTLAETSPDRETVGGRLTAAFPDAQVSDSPQAP